MLKRLAILVLLTIGLPIYGQKESAKPGSNQRQSDSSKKPPTSGMAACLIKQEGTAIECEWPQADPPSYLSRLLVPENLPNLLLVAVGIGGIVAAVCTLCIIRRQTDATEKAADAALRNAQAFISAERPWILVKAEPSKHWKSGYQLVAVNKGRTPAEVISHTDNCVVIGIVDSLPDTAEYGNRQVSPPLQIILPEESVVIGEFTEYSLVGKNQADITRFRNAETEGYVYGSVVYRDLLGPPAAKSHETRWCFAVMTWGEQELMVREYGWGGNEYTRHT